MHARFKNHQEEWIPVSEWGRKMKAEREQLNIVTVYKPQVMKKRIRVSNTPYVAGKCSMCPGHVGPQNKSGVCSKCCKTNVRLALKIGPRPVCKVCGVTVNRDNTRLLCPTHKAAAFSGRCCSKCPISIRENNKSGMCRLHSSAAHRKPMVVRPTCTMEGCANKLNSQNKIGRCDQHRKLIVKPVGRPRGFSPISDRKCAECDSFIRRDNVSGLCAKHSMKFWNKVKSQRRKAA